MGNSNDNKKEAYENALTEFKIFLSLYNSDKTLSLEAVLTSLVSTIKNNIKDFNFVGFYMVHNKSSLSQEQKDKLALKDDCHLEVGAYNSDIVATPKIDYGKGVVGACWEKGDVIIENDVTQCKNYIACDDVTKSEICLPLKEEDKVLGVLDIDSTEKNRFEDIDKEYLVKLLELTTAK
mmetsp:Transcript_30811/g.32011  ORF Transcript_30811/g.32011 Transcript_30811/m.32011 type:complete len:179 (+) Transcript_30811:7-543(+)